MTNTFVAFPDAFESTIDSINAGLAIVNHSGYIQLANRNFAFVCGKEKADLSGLQILDLLNELGIQNEHGENLSKEALKLRGILDESNDFTQVISFANLPTKNYYLLSITPVGNQSTNEFALFFLEDITEQKALEYLKDEFIGIVSHELKNPLSVIRGLAQLLMICLKERRSAIRELGLTHFSEEMLISKTETQCLENVLQEIDRITAMIDQMVQITRIDSGKLQLVVSACNLNSITEDVISHFASNTSAGRIQFEPAELCLQGLIDANAFRQVITNLISNALKYSPSDTPVTVRLYRQDNCVCIATTDRGIGIPYEEQKTIFTKFYRTFSATTLDVEGLGLGLYITKRLVELHGGTIKLTSQPGCGSTFEACFPAVDELSVR